MIEFRTTNEAETLALGRRLASLLNPGDVILLAGRLGCGKTLFTCGLAEGLGVEEMVTSPSYVLVRTYSGLMPLVHADVYRLGSLAELEDLELSEDTTDSVLVVEWGNAVRAGLPADHLLIEFEVANNGDRTLRFLPQGGWRRRTLTELSS